MIGFDAQKVSIRRKPTQNVINPSAGTCVDPEELFAGAPASRRRNNSDKFAAAKLKRPAKSKLQSPERGWWFSELSGLGFNDGNRLTANRRHIRTNGTWPRKSHLQFMTSTKSPARGAPRLRPTVNTVFS